MKQPEREHPLVSQMDRQLGGRRFFQLVGALIILLIFISCFLVLIVYSLMWLWMFGYLHIADSAEQVILVLAPLPVVGYWLWRRGIVR